MAARVVYFGDDDCYRITVLRRAGYEAEECHSLSLLESNLIQFPATDAVAIAERDETVDAEKAISLVRSKSTVPLILFQGRNRVIETSAFQLVVPPLTDPGVWLNDLATLIDCSRAVREQSQLIRAKSALLREQSAAARKNAQEQCERAASLIQQIRAKT